VHFVKRRYLLVQIAGSEIVNERDLMGTIWNAILQLFGEYGASQTSLILMKYNLEPSYVILRCSNKALDLVKASIASIAQINSKPVALRVLGVSGTLKGLSRQRPEIQI